MILLNSCIICKGGKFIEKLKCKDYSASKEIFTIVSCETCGFLFTNPRPSEENISDYYLSDMYISHTNKKTGLFKISYEKRVDGFI